MQSDICFEEKHLPAVIRLSGSRAALERAVLKCTLPFTEAVQCQRERRLNPDREHPETTFNLTVSESCGDSVRQQIRDVEDFLATDGRLITDLIQSVEGCSCIIDLSWDFPSNAIGQFNRFGSSLLSKLGELKIELEISVYGTANEATLGTTILNAEATIASNDSKSTQWSDDSFIGFLHERHQWDTEAYFRFEAALYELCDARMTDAVLRKFVDRVAARVFGYTMLMFSCHFDSCDGFRVQNLHDDELRVWQQRFQLVLEGFFANSLPRAGTLQPLNRFIANA